MRYPVLFVSLLLLATMLRVAFAQAVLVPPTKPSPHGQVALMAKALNLSDVQVTKLIEKLAEIQTATTNWYNVHREQEVKLRSAQATALDAGDKVTSQRIQQQLRAFSDALIALREKGQQELMALLTPEQQLSWSAYQLLQQGDFVAVQKLVTFTPDQLTQLKAQAKTFAASQRKWQDEHGEKIQKLQQLIRDTQDELGALMADQDKLTADNRTAIYALLTPEQQLTIFTSQIQQDMLARVNTKKAKLTAVQIDAARALCVPAAKQILAIPATDSKARTQATERLYQSICELVLTDEQRRLLAKLK